MRIVSMGAKVSLLLLLGCLQVIWTGESKATAQGQAIPSGNTANSQVEQLLAKGKQQYRRAEFKAAIATYQQVLNQPQVGTQAKTEALLQLGVIDLWIEQISQAELKVKEALKLAQDGKDRRTESKALAMLSWVERSRQDYVKATELATQGLKISQEVGDREGEAFAQFMLGIIFNLKNQNPQALETFQQALKLAQVSNSQDLIAHIYDWMAGTHVALKDFKQAELLLQQQQDLSKSIGYTLAEFDGLNTITRLQKEQHQSEKVLANRQKQLKIAQLSNNSWFQKYVLAEIGWFYANQKQTPQALEAFQKALEVAKTIDDANVADIQHLLGIFYKNTEQYPQALEVCTKALATYKRTKNLPRQANILLLIGSLYSQQGVLMQNQSKPVEAHKFFEQSLHPFQESSDIFHQIQDRDGEMGALQMLGMSYIGQGQNLLVNTAYEEAITVLAKSVARLKTAKAIAKEMNNSQSEQVIIRQIRISYVSRNHALVAQQKNAEAISILQEGILTLKQYENDIPKEAFLQEMQSILGELGRVLHNSGNYSESLSKFQEALENSEMLNSKGSNIFFLFMIASNHSRMSNYTRALEVNRKVLALIQKNKETTSSSNSENGPVSEIDALNQVGISLIHLGQYENGMEYYQKALNMARREKAPRSELSVLNNIGSAYSEKGEYSKALIYLQQSIDILERYIQQVNTGDKASIAQFCNEVFINLGANGEKQCFEMTQSQLSAVLHNLGRIYNAMGRHTEALLAYDKAMSIATKYEDVHDQMYIFNGIGNVHSDTGNYVKALDAHQKSLTIATNSNNRSNQASALNNIGRVYQTQAKYSEALEFCQKSLDLARIIQSPDTESTALNSIGSIYSDLGEYEKALEFYNQALNISQRIGASTVAELNNIAQVYLFQGNYVKALEENQKALEIAHVTGNIEVEITILQNIGVAYNYQSNYVKAQEYYQKALSLSQERGNIAREISNSLAQGHFHLGLGQYSQALKHYQNALNLSQKTGDIGSEVNALFNIGTLYRKQEDSRAIQFYQKVFNIAQTTGDLTLKGISLRGLAQTYEKQKDFDRALNLAQQALTIQDQIGDRPQKALTLNTIGQIYLEQGNLKSAQEILQQALIVTHEINDLAYQALTSKNLGELHTKKNQPELAIAFYKKSVNTYEKIRTTNKKLSSEQQASYTQTVRSTYEDLAALLFKENRIAEALQVLDLLKVQDLQDFLKDLKGNELPTQGISLLPQETTILQNFEQQNPRSLDQWLTQPNLQTLIQQIKTTAPSEGLKSPGYKALQTRLTQLSPNSALFYPLILPDRLELVILTPNKPPIHHTVENLPKAKLEQLIDTFSQQIGTPSDLETTKTTAKQLYDIIIGPIAADLKAANITTLLYAPDGKLRYIPLAALHDGQNWLIQTYTINHLTALALTPTTPATTSQPKALVGAVTQGSTIIGGGRSYTFPPLSNTAPEANAIGTLFGTQPLIDEDLTRQNLQANLPSINIFHLASHAEFNPQSPDLSFILLGNNQTLTLRDLKDLKLPNINLFVLSACETAKGVNKDGIELFGFGYQLQRNQVRAAIASLWKVNDSSTSQLMQSFYKNLNTRKISPVEALQRAQRETLGDPTWNQLPNGQQLRSAEMGHAPNAPILPVIRRGDPTHPLYIGGGEKPSLR